MTDTKRLKEIIKDQGITKKRLAERMSLSSYGLALKIDGKQQFKSEEIKSICNILGINNPEDIVSIFFA